MRTNVAGFNPKKVILKLSKIGIIYLSFFVRGFILVLISPYLSRVLSTSVWGELITAQVAANWLSIIVDFGFVISAGTKLALRRNDVVIVKSIVSGVIGAKLMLSFGVVCIGFAFTKINIIQSFGNYSLSIIILAIIQGFSPMWYFQAVEKLYIYAGIDLLFRSLFILLIFRIIDGDEDVLLVLNLLSFCLLLANVITSYIMWCRTPVWKLTWQNTYLTLREGSSMFLFTLTTSIYNSASILLLAVFSNPSAVAVYGNADRIIRAVISFIGPMNQIFMPKSTRAFAVSYNEGIKFTKKLLSLYILIGSLGFGVITAFSSRIIDLFYGSNYGESAEILQVLSILLPIICINTVLSFHLLVPFGRYRQMTYIYMIVSIISAISIFCLVPKYQIFGMLFAVISPEICALVILSVYIQRKVLGKKHEI